MNPCGSVFHFFILNQLLIAYANNKKRHINFRQVDNGKKLEEKNAGEHTKHYRYLPIVILYYQNLIMN